MIKRIRIQNFRSLADVTVDLGELTVLIGRSGTGKSNFVHAIRFLRDSLNSRTPQFGPFGGSDKVLHAKYKQLELRYDVTLAINGIAADLRYKLSIRPNGQIDEERLAAGDRVLFHHSGQRWQTAPRVVPEPSAGSILLGAIPGLDESTRAYVALRSGIGCYDFPSTVLQGDGKSGDPADRHFGDQGLNYLAVADRIVTDPNKWMDWRRIARAIGAVNQAASGMTLDVPGAQRITVDLSLNGSVLPLDVRQESDGFRRFLAHLLAMYQIPSKQTLLFEHPETGLHPGALEALFEEFQTCPLDGRGQIVLTTHSPQLLDYFGPVNIRVVDIENQESRIGPLAPEQAEVLKDALLHPGELLTVDPARLEGQLAEVPE